MRRQRVGAAVLFGAAALLLAPATSQAQFTLGFGRFGTGYGMGYGYYPGVYSYGYYPGTYSYGYSPGYNLGYYSYGYAPYSWGYSPTYTSSYYPSYYWYGSSGYYPGTTWGSYGYPAASPTDYYSTATMGSGSSYPSNTASYSYGAPARPQQNSVLLNVRLPDPNADVWVEGKLTQQRGTSREYQSPPIDPNRNFVYDVRARWTQDGKEVEQTKTVRVRANDIATVDFTASKPTSRVEEVERLPAPNK
jgi:uncharacterized protein (TIGR03000 family)